VVAENLYRKATGEGREAVTAAIFWLKARAGWRETQIHETRAEVQCVARMPAPVADVDEWMRRYAPQKAVEHRPAEDVGEALPHIVNGSSW
jgi:hypothetical protein